jgi:Protein of unknown function (DUF3237)
MRLVPEMTYRETIQGPWGPTTGSPLGARICWQVTSAELAGARISARLAMPGADWIRLGPDGIRRQDQRLTFVTDDNAVILLSYERYSWLTRSLFIGEGRVAGDHRIEYVIHRLD